MNKNERATLENIVRNLKDYEICPRREQLEFKIRVTLACISSMLKIDKEKE